MKKKSLTSLKIGTLFLGALFATSAFVSLPTPAYASDLDSPLQLGNQTLINLSTAADKIKGYTLDPLAWIVSKATLQSMVKSMANWASHGFNGSPSFVTDLNKQLLSVGDASANNFLSQLTSNGSIKSPFQTAIASVTGNNYKQSTGSNGFFGQNPFTLGKVSPNPTTAMNGGIMTKQGGGLNAWISAWSNTANNPYGASMLASNALGAQVGNAQSVQKAELDWAQGLLSSRGNCPTTTTGGTTQKTVTPTSTTGGAAAATPTSAVSLSAPSTCQSKPIQVPGSVLKALSDKTWGSSIDTLVSAHSFNEIVSSLLSQLTSQILSRGLTGLTQPSSSGGSTSFINAPDPNQIALSNSTGANFSTTLTNQIAVLQKFVTQWNTINNAAQSAKTALTSTACFPNAQATITNTVQPIINQAASSISQANASIAALQKIQAQLPTANSTTDQTAAVTAATTAYSDLLAGNTLPADATIADAAFESNDTSSNTSGTMSFLTQMNNITKQATTCIPTAH
jgi:hypothetical protein